MTRTLRIAIADDEPDMQEYYRTILPALGHVVVAVADTGRELVQKCRDQQPDLVITDVKMPDMDGIEAAGANLRRRADPCHHRLGSSRQRVHRTGGSRSRPCLSRQADQTGKP